MKGNVEFAGYIQEVELYHTTTHTVSDPDIITCTCLILAGCRYVHIANAVHTGACWYKLPLIKL